MGKKSSSAPALPDEYYQSLNRQTELAEQQQEWYQNTMYPWLKETTDEANKTAAQQLAFNQENAEWWQNYAKENSDKQNGIADWYYNRFKNTYAPIENNLVDQANNFNTNAYAEKQAQQAIGDVASQYANQRRTNQAQMQQYGINPNSGAYQYQQNALGIQQAALQASAANQARNAATEMGWNKNLQLAQLGQNYMNAAQGMYNTATNTGTSGAGVSQNAANSALNASQSALGNVSNFANIGLNSYNSMSNAWGNIGNQALSGYQQQQAIAQQNKNAASSTTGAILGAVGSIGGSMFGPVGTAVGKFLGDATTAALTKK